LKSPKPREADECGERKHIQKIDGKSSAIAKQQQSGEKPEWEKLKLTG
jgi:hypothetical protein